jgi:branched-chain amino acid transport system permease protein
MDIYFQLLWNAVSYGLFTAMLAVSFSSVYAVSRVLHVAHGALVLLAGYFFAAFMGAGLGFFLSASFAAVCAAVLGVLVNAFVYEPLRRRGRLRGEIALVASLAILIILQNAILAVWSSRTIRVHTFFDALPSLQFFHVIFTPETIVTSVSACLFFVALWWVMKKTTFGSALRAVSDREEMAEIVGVNVQQIRVITFFFCSFTAGIAGVLSAILFHLEPNRSLFYAMDAFSSAIVGGLGSVPGAVVAALGINFISDAGGFFLSSAFDDLFGFLLAFLFLLYRPQGLFGKPSPSDG